MEEPSQYQDVLAAALVKKAAYLEEVSLPDLGKKLRSFQTLFEGLHNILLRKSLVQEDPYRYDHKSTEVTIPPDDPLSETDKKEKLSRRLSEYATQLDFLNHTFQFSLDFLSLERIKPLVDLIKYIDWQRLNESRGNSTTGAFAEALTKIRVSGDSLSTSLVKDSVTQICATIRHVLVVLKEVAFYQRQVYKLELRREVLPLLPDKERVNPEEMPKRIKVLFFQLHKGGESAGGKRVFYPELVREIVAEDAPAGGQELRDEVVRKLAVPEKKSGETRPADYRSGLLEGIRIMVVSSFHLDAALRVLRENVSILETQNRGFFARLRRWLEGGKSRRTRLLEISYEDPSTSTRREERLDFTAFAARTLKRIRLFGALANQMSAAHQRLQAAPDEQIYAFLDKNLQELRLLHNRMTGLGAYFKNQRPRDPRKKFKGIKIELSAMKNCIVKANKQLHEYLSLKEEEEQMAKLGLK
jgi:hypothetical protein